MKRLMALFVAAGLGVIAGIPASAQSTFGCSDLESVRDFPAVEGNGGVFFRIRPDMYNFFPVADETVERLAEFAEALATGGTRLIVLPVPTKAVAMPGLLPAAAGDFGHDPDLAATVHDDILRRLEERGVAAVNLRRPMVRNQTEAPGYFQTDHRWTAAGTRIAADAVAARLAEAGVSDMRRPGGPAATDGTPVTLESKMFAQLQQHCQLALPPVTTSRHRAAPAEGAGRASLLAATVPVQVAVVGTEYTGEPVTDFVGLLADRTGLEVAGYHVAEGGGIAAISAYLTSAAFQTARPAVLVWEFPVDTNLGQFGDQPLRELTAAAGDTCDIPLSLFATSQPNRISVDLNVLDPAQEHTLFLDTGGAQSPEAIFVFRSQGGLTRSRVVVRHPGQHLTGRFAMPMSGLWPEGAVSVDIELTTAFGANARVMACSYVGKG